MNNQATNGPQEMRSAEGQEIDLMEMAKKVWEERKLLLKVCGIAAVVGLITGFSIPKEYTTEILIAPESTGTTRNGGFSSLASLAGLNMGSLASKDAIYPDLYPDIVKSTPFLIGLFDIPVRQMNDSTTILLSEYLRDHQKQPWWKGVAMAPFRLIGWAMSLFREEKKIENEEIDLFHLTREQAGTARAIGSRIQIKVEKKTSVTTLGVTMQDPLVSATVADSVRVLLQEYVTDYRTSKARMTLEYTEKLAEEARKDYYEAQARYADFADANQGLSLLRSRAELEKLQNEMSLAYTAYNSMGQQLQLAKAKVEEITPVYTIIQPASVPLHPSKPSKTMILIGCVFLAGLGCVGWILFLRNFLNEKKSLISKR